MNDANKNTIGAIWVIDVARVKGAGNAGIEFGKKIGGSNFASDIYVNGIHIECKSWAKMLDGFEPQLVAQMAAKLNEVGTDISKMAYYWARYKPDAATLKNMLISNKTKLVENMSPAQRLHWFPGSTGNTIEDADIINFINSNYSQFMF
jgi:hypothetical protein